jgi:predicted RNase H-like HicB family nuclease
VAVAHGEQTEHLTILFDETDDGWVAARIAEVPAAISQGRTHDEARANVIDALHDLLDPHSRPTRPLERLRVAGEDATKRLRALIGR